MKPLGRKTVKFHSKTDCHPEKGHVNWWEQIALPDKRSERQQSKLNIKQEIKMGEFDKFW